MSALPYLYYAFWRDAICLKEKLAYFALLLFFHYNYFGLSEEIFEVSLQILKSIMGVVLKLMQNESELFIRCRIYACEGH
jgi:hypothetical protein